MSSKIILISGPTASGKSYLAIKIAKKLDGEIINADSMQVYKELSTLTARPLKNDQKNIKHKVLFEKVGRGIDEYVGRTEQFSPVTVVSKENLVGQIRRVEINSVMSHSLRGTLK